MKKMLIVTMALVSSLSLSANKMSVIQHEIRKPYSKGVGDALKKYTYSQSELRSLRDMALKERAKISKEWAKLKAKRKNKGSSRSLDRKKLSLDNATKIVELLSNKVK